MKSVRRFAPFSPFWMAAVVFLWACVLFAQTDPLPPPPAPPAVPPIDPALVNQLIVAWNARAYPLVGALVVGALLALAKNGWFSSAVAGWLPAKARPWIAPIVGVLTVTVASIKAGVTWPIAIAYGVLSGLTASAGHDMVINGLRDGKEFIPKAPWHKPNGSSSGGSAGDPPKPDHFSAPPPRAVRESLLGRRTVLARSLVALPLPVLLGGCASWWKGFLADPVAQINALVSFVGTFIPGVQALWTLIAPALGDKQEEATTIFKNAVVTLQDACSAASDAVAAAVAAKTEPTDPSAIMKPIQDAVAQVMAILAQWKGTPVAAGSMAATRLASPEVSTRYASLQTRAATIAHWGG